MKGIAIILAGCMLFLNLENFQEKLEFSVEAAEMECCGDCCADCCDKEGEQHDDKAPVDPDKDCSPTCDCSNQFHITAIAYHFMTLTGITVQSCHYGNYVNSYTFEYSADFLQPPRFG